MRNGASGSEFEEREMECECGDESERITRLLKAKSNAFQNKIKKANSK